MEKQNDNMDSITIQIQTKDKLKEKSKKKITIQIPTKDEVTDQLKDRVVSRMAAERKNTKFWDKK